jgi:hypothetical protein
MENLKPEYSLMFTDNGQNVIESQYRTLKIMQFLAEEIAQETGRPVALCKGYALPCNIVEKYRFEPEKS